MYKRGAARGRRRIIDLVVEIFLWLPLQCLQHTEHVQRQLTELHLCNNTNLCDFNIICTNVKVRVIPVHGSCQL